MTMQHPASHQFQYPKVTPVAAAPAPKPEAAGPGKDAPASPRR
jgi:hypothetical protein